MRSQYEFSSSQNELIGDLSQKMLLVGNFLIVIGVLAAIFGGVVLAQGTFAGIGSLIQGVAQIPIGIWTFRASRSFKLIADTRGSDIENVMGGMGELRKLYTLQYWLIMLALIFMTLGLIAILITSSGGR